MKFFLSMAITFCWALNAQAQSDADANAEWGMGNNPYLLPAFTQGTVHFKTGLPQEALLNYNALFQQMVFNKRGELLAIDHLATIDTVRIGGRIFVPVDTVFFELVSERAAVPLFIHYQAQLALAGTNIGFNSSNQTAPSENLESFRIGNVTPYESRIPDKYKITAHIDFLVKSKETYMVLTNVKQISNYFPGKDKAIRQYMRDHDFSWGKVDDMEKLFIFCNGPGN